MKSSETSASLSSPTSVTHSTENASTSTITVKTEKTEKTEKQEPKHVHFNKRVKVVLIPDKTELAQKKLITRLWLDEGDYPTMMKEARTELRHFICERELQGEEPITYREAATLLFQPDPSGLFQSNAYNSASESESESEREESASEEENTYPDTWRNVPGVRF